MHSRAKPASTEHPAERYAREAASGKIICSRLVRLSAQRHRRDLAEGHKRGLHFDFAAAQCAIDFFTLLHHSKGEWAGRVIALEPWQQFNVWCIFGWKRADGTRRFRNAYIQIAKKNGKSTMAAGIGLEMLILDGEPGAEVYCAATKKDQAKIVFTEAERMRNASPSIKKRVKSFRNNLSIPETNSKFEPLGADTDTLDGPNIHCLIFDELHAYKTRAILDVLEGGTIARRQPLIFKITTAGSNRQSACWQEREYAERVLEGLVTDDSTFAFIAELDPGDDWEDEKNWPKANPNLGVSVKLDYLQSKAAKAKSQPTYRNAFLRFHLNVWTQQSTAAISIEKWNECVGFPLAGIDPKILREQTLERLRGRRCFAAVDLSSKVDLTALVLAFEPESDSQPWILMPWFWMPKENIFERAREDRVPYDVWEREGFIIATPGNFIDQDFIVAEIIKLRGMFEFSENAETGSPEVAFDPWNSSQAAVDLQSEGFSVVEFRQGYKSLSEPTKSFLGMIPAKKIAHLANPVLSWNASNLMVTGDPAGNIKPTKEEAAKKIDGIVASIMALGRGLSVAADANVFSSDDQGVFTV